MNEGKYPFGASMRQGGRKSGERAVPSRCAGDEPGVPVLSSIVMVLFGLPVLVMKGMSLTSDPLFFAL